MKKIVIIIFMMLFMSNVKAIETSASSAILMDTDNNIILYEKDIHKVRSVASISKIMTAVLAIESDKMDDKIIVDDVISDAYGSAIYIKEGEELTLRDLVYGLMLRSGNDAALVIAKYVGGNVDHFVEMMNNKASEIGMDNTTFNNPHGLDVDKGNYSTAYDMAILTSYAMKLDEYRKITVTKSYSLKTNKNTYVWKNKNKLLRLYKYTTGGKTGFTDIAKRTLVTTASKDGINLVAVTLNDGNDFNDHIDLFDYGFSNYTNHNIIKKGIINVYDDYYYADYELYTKDNYNYIINNGEEYNVVLKFELEKKRSFKNDDVVGNIIVMIDDVEVHRQLLYVRNKSNAKKKDNNIFDWFKSLW